VVHQKILHIPKLRYATLLGRNTRIPACRVCPSCSLLLSFRGCKWTGKVDTDGNGLPVSPGSIASSGAAISLSAIVGHESLRDLGGAAIIGPEIGSGV